MDFDGRMFRARRIANAMISGMPISEVAHNEGLTAQEVKQELRFSLGIEEFPVELHREPTVPLPITDPYPSQQTEPVEEQVRRASGWSGLKSRREGGRSKKAQRNYDRARRLADQLIAGATFEQVGAREKMGKFRVKKIVIAAGMMPEVEAAWAYRKEFAERAETPQVVTMSRVLFADQAKSEDVFESEVNQEARLPLVAEDSVAVPLVETVEAPWFIDDEVEQETDQADGLRNFVSRMVRFKRIYDALSGGTPLADVMASERLSLEEIGEEFRFARKIQKSLLVVSNGPTKVAPHVKCSTKRDSREERRLAAERENFIRGSRFADARISGDTLQQIASREGITRERVRQIIIMSGLEDKVKDAQAQQRAIREQAERGEKEKRLRRRKMEVKENSWSYEKLSDEKIINSVHEWLMAGGSGSVVDWNYERRSPSSALICKRFGWAEVIRLAGGEPQREVFGHRSDRYSEESCIDYLVEFLSDESELLGTAEAYNRWAKRNRAPSSQTIRNRLGTWSKAKSLAVRKIEAARLAELPEVVPDGLS